MVARRSIDYLKLHSPGLCFIGYHSISFKKSHSSVVDWLERRPGSNRVFLPAEFCDTTLRPNLWSVPLTRNFLTFICLHFSPPLFKDFYLTIPFTQHVLSHFFYFSFFFLLITYIYCSFISFFACSFHFFIFYFFVSLFPLFRIFAVNSFFWHFFHLFIHSRYFTLFRYTLPRLFLSVFTDSAYLSVTCLSISIAPVFIASSKSRTVSRPFLSAQRNLLLLLSTNFLYSFAEDDSIALLSANDVSKDSSRASLVLSCF